MPGKAKDLTGPTFGRFTVREQAKAHSIGHAYWLCDCACGNRGIVVRSTRLLSGRQVSCGCQRADPAIRRAARWVVSPRRRSQIAESEEVEVSLDQQDKQWILDQLKATQRQTADLITSVKESLEREMREGFGG
jgi:hypothetical protein